MTIVKKKYFYFNSFPNNCFWKRHWVSGARSSSQERCTKVFELSNGEQQFSSSSGARKLWIELIVLPLLWQLPKIKVHPVGDMF
jgi:hypothetical protein